MNPLITVTEASVPTPSSPSQPWDVQRQHVEPYDVVISTYGATHAMSDKLEAACAGTLCQPQHDTHTHTHTPELSTVRLAAFFLRRDKAAARPRPPCCSPRCPKRQLKGCACVCVCVCVCTDAGKILFLAEVIGSLSYVFVNLGAKYTYMEKQQAQGEAAGKGGSAGQMRELAYGRLDASLSRPVSKCLGRRPIHPLYQVRCVCVCVCVCVCGSTHALIVSWYMCACALCVHS